MTYRTRVSLAVAVLSLLVSHVAAQPAARVTSSDGRAEVTDAAGDVDPIVYRVSVGDGPEKEVKYPGFDVVKLAVISDGKAVTFAATLKTPPAQAAFEVIEFHVDADNNPKTGVTHPDSKLLTGLEFYGTLEACLEHSMFGTMCAGTDPKPAGLSAVVTLEKYGKEWMFKDALFDIPAAGKVKEARKTPIAGPLVQSSIDYSALGVKSGQTIRLVVREYGTGKVDNVSQGYFPEIILTLK